MTPISRELALEMFKARDKAIEVAVGTMSARLDGMNEFRSSLKDAAAAFVTRTEIEQRLSAQETRIRGLERLIYIGVGAALIVEAALQFLHH